MRFLGMEPQEGEADEGFAALEASRVAHVSSA